MDLISIILPTYNRVEYLEKSIYSVINQSYMNWELLIVDDGSTDGTNHFIKKYINKYRNIRYYFHENRGAPYSMNVGISDARGEFITFLGSDDEFKQNHLGIRIKCFKENLNVDLIHSPAEIVGNRFVKDKNDKSKKIDLDDCIIGGTLFGRRNVFKELNGFKELNYSPESEFIERAEVKYIIKKFNERTYIYNRDTPDSICNNI